MPRLTVVYDNKTNGSLQSGWGFSCLVEQEDKKVLFDTGWDGQAVLDNLGQLEIDPETIDILVLSHHHWDHIGGLSHILHAARNLKVYVPSSFPQNLKSEISRYAEVVEITDSCEIMQGIYSSGELGIKPPEQSLIVRGNTGFFVVTGCAHPGIGPILENASSYGKVIGIIGGLHSLEEMEMLEDIQYIAAGHCTRRMEELQALYGDRYIPIFSGYSIDF
ncbi:7,8-dihydropterin-6-yl-methyl-4-(beta-D-ribofuranosyl)aminobenzene 5'-phosphate synthase [Methanohalophilus levihalophilus]|uniref:MBL fold metallo-hydrolase n=1 Tax=Methanohalophilus levihalophilus TaxID=1431282 RepID=UPI001AE24631|nr:MBL fold metallo-hydrolase [Methanohalophilus levihalophilus]MBP2030146.1 7,8-dihydropterin-6-yl-methyl-4-(beta-D-ribofuranosyl)aminobenzene 5'-phosphate synthase [Methanohalophilus levihalophilus]